MSDSDFLDGLFEAPPIEPYRELAAYESLWLSEGATFKTVAELFLRNPGMVPSELVTEEAVSGTRVHIEEALAKAGIDDFGVSVHGTADYPKRLRDATYPIELFYYLGYWDLAYADKSVAIVGSRKPTEEGIRRARKLSSLLVREGFTIFSGLAEGIDTAAHQAALDHDGRTVAVIGTPITEAYPKSNRGLQEIIARDHLLISQVPMLRYARQSFKWNRLFFPERNVTMSALSDATVIVEAGETSGTLTQARAALKQGRKLFILDSCFRNPALTWPAKYEKMGAVRVREFEQILDGLAHAS
ncbi:DNA-processing protein DprA [Kerstersia gyiorum]|nr:DNA-processing protein DprA [Kerstersia gyiorum]